MSKVVFTVAIGAPKYIEQALGLARSLSFVGDRTPRIVMSDSNSPALHRWFDQVVPPTANVLTFLQKLEGLNVSDADEILFIDSDSLVFERLDRVWSSCEGAPIAVQGNWVIDGHWYGQLSEILPRLQLSGLPMFNGGMIYYRRCPETVATFEELRQVAESYEKTGLDRFRGTVPDEPCLAIAMARTGHYRLLPDTLDLMNTPVGLVGRLNIDIRRRKCQFIKFNRHGMRLMRPAILHAGKYVLNAIYWKQLNLLEKYERYADLHGFGYMSPSQKLERSVQRRILKIRGKI